MTRREARLALREATGCSLAACLSLIPEPGASREVLAGMALQGMLAGRVAGEPHMLAYWAVDYADKLLAALAEPAPAAAEGARGKCGECGGRGTFVNHPASVLCPRCCGTGREGTNG